MHIPAEMLHGAICPVTATLAIVGVTIATYLVSRQKNHPGVTHFARVTSVVFSLQMLNAYVGSGISGHLLGGVLASALLGTPLGVLSMSVVLLLQTLIFADGGILMLGANIFNMALLGAGVGGMVYQWLQHSTNRDVSLLLAGTLSVLLAVMGVSLELFSCGRLSYALFTSLLQAHLPIALAEGMATLFLYRLLHFNVENSARSSQWRIYGLVIIAALLVTPITSVYPDALEGTLSNVHLLSSTSNFAHAPLADYKIGEMNGYLSVITASSVGIMAVCCFSISVVKASQL